MSRPCSKRSSRRDATRRPLPSSARLRLEALEERIALTTLTITPVNPTVAVGATLQFHATEDLDVTGAGNVDVTSRVTWLVSNGTGQGTIESFPSGTTPGLFRGIRAGTVVVQATDSQVRDVSGAPLQAQTTATVTPLPTSVAVAASSGTHAPGESVTFTATVSAAGTSSGSGVPTGAVAFDVDGASLGSVPVDRSGQASVTASLTAGSHVIGATYSGDGTFGASMGTASVSVIPAPTPTPAPAPTPTPTEPAPKLETPNEAWVEQIYADFLHRSAGPAELGFWYSQLEADVPRLSVVNDVIHSPEHEENTVVGLYQALLGHAPDPVGLAAQSQALAQGLPARLLRADIFGSLEYFQGHGKNEDGAWVDAVFRDSFGHGADAVSQQSWLRFLVGGHNRTETALAILSTPEARTMVVSDLYGALLHRTLDPGANFWIDALLNGSSEDDVAAGVAASLEYFRSPQTMPKWDVPHLEAWVTQAYSDVLGRQVDPKGLAFSVGEIEDGSSRVDVVTGIVHSSEYRTREIKDAYQVLLHRPADQLGLNTLVPLLEGGSTLEQLKALLMGSSEYFFGRGGGTLAGFADAVVLDALGRPIDSTQLAFLGGLLATETREEVASQVLHFPDAEALVVADVFASLLHRDADPAATSFYVAQIESGARDEDVVAAVTASLEYYLKHGPS